MADSSGNKTWRLKPAQGVMIVINKITFPAETSEYYYSLYLPTVRGNDELYPCLADAVAAAILELISLHYGFPPNDRHED